MKIVNNVLGSFTAENMSLCFKYCCVPALVFYVISLTVMQLSGFTLVEILRDPAQQTKQSSFLGFVSNIGTWLWLAAATICFFRVSTFGKPSPDGRKSMIRMAGWFSLVLAVDDFFLIHDRYITEGILIPLYAGFLFYMLKRQLDNIIKIDGFAFIMAGGLLAGSVVVDAVQEILPISYGLSQAFEEGFKFVGAAAWLYFCYRISAFGLRTHTTDSENA